MNPLKTDKKKFNIMLLITGAIRCTSQKRIFNELNLEFPGDRRWYS